MSLLRTLLPEFFREAERSARQAEQIARQFAPATPAASAPAVVETPAAVAPSGGRRTMPQYAERAVRRRTANIERLSTDFQKQVQQLTGEQAKAFSAYQAQTAATMAPYESALKTYQSNMATYDAQAAAYASRLKAYQDQLAEIAANPTVKKIEVIEEKVPRAKVFGKDLGSYIRRTEVEVEEPRPLPAAFTEAAPVAPTAPVRPEIAAFSTEPFQARRKGLEEGLQRELGERRSARLAAVSRRSRSMLSGA